MVVAKGPRLWLLAGLAGAAGLAILHVWHPSNDPATAFCLSRRLFHLPCPACGMTRAFAHLGTIAGQRRHNWLPRLRVGAGDTIERGENREVREQVFVAQFVEQPLADRHMDGVDRVVVGEGISHSI